MFDLVSKHKRFAQLILFIMAVPFAFFGVDYYFRSASADGTIATVGSDKVTQAEYDSALREQQDRARQMMGKNFDPAMFDNPEVRYAILDQIVSQHLIAGKAKAERFRVSDSQLQEAISSIPAFQEDGKFSQDRYRQLLAGQNMSPPMFEQRMRQDMLQAAVQEPIGAANIVARPSTEKYLGLLEQRRDVSVATIEAEPYAKEAKVDDAAVKAFYDKNQVNFQTPEQAKIEYVMLSQDALLAQTNVDAADVKKQYDANAKQYTAPEERSASHILIAVKPDASDADKAAAKKLADDLYARAKANPAKFGDLAKEYSKDPGSAQQGGDLGSFGRGTMVKPFEDAAFAAKPGDIIAPVQTDFGWHVIKVTGVKEAHTQAFDEVKVQIEADLKRQQAAQKFATAADQFQNIVYEQADSLAGAGKALNLKVETTPFITRDQAQALAMGNAKFVQSLFAPESVQAKRNLEATEIGPNVLISARIVDYKPAAPRAFDDVKEAIRRQLVMQAAAGMAQTAGKAKLALLEQGKSDKDAGVTFGKPTLVSRNQAQQGFTPDAVAKVFQVNPDKLPAYVGTGNERGGYSIYKVLTVNTPSNADKAKMDAASGRLGDQIGRELSTAYVASLKAKSDVKINQGNLDKK
jgi:peptidyl-prolyl cis-trans isomerase D